MRTTNNGLTAGNSQSVKTYSKITTYFIATCSSIKRATSCFHLNLGRGAQSIMMLTLLVVLLTQGVLQWLR